MLLKVKSRSIAVFIAIKTAQSPKVLPNHFAFTVDGLGRVGGKTLGEWEREYAVTPYNVFNQLIRSYGDEQRRIRKLTKSHNKEEISNG